MKSRKDGNSQYFDVQGSGTKVYKVTINYQKGHWCECRGMISMKQSWQEDAGKTQGTSCKHVKEIIREEFENDWGTKNSDGSVVVALTDSSGGTASETIVAIGGTYDQAEVRNAVASLAQKISDLIDHMNDGRE